jgi:hypothetical protein
MREQSELYHQDVGYDDFDEFTNPPLDRIEFALRQDNKLIGFAYLVRKALKVCEFGLIAPPRSRVRSLFTLLKELQRAYFNDLGFLSLYAECADDPGYNRPRRMCKMFGWQERKPNYFEYNVYDHLRASNGKQESTSQS